MIGTRPLYIQPFRRAAGGRFGLALAVSVLVHLLIAAGLVSDSPQQNTRNVRSAPIAVRLEPPQSQSVVPVMETVGEDLLKPRRLSRAAAMSESPRRDALLQPAPAGPQTLPQVADPTVYAARDLDAYPR